MTERLEQRYCIKFCQKFGDTQAETIRKIQQAFGDDAMGVTQIKEWFNRFIDGCMSSDGDLRSGRQSTSRNADVIEARYTPDMAPCDFWLFPRLKTPLKAPVLTDARISYRTRRRSCTPFQNCFQRWKDRWAKCVESQGAYCEGN
ncbi:hypothetical protein B7P43_G02294 [Cryptotermes secundus]|uniref:Mos1 transposase HTH domain-containing protein n=1 Tax=Cryptotermes secundus TaxID=105785 RepID=A0A2J7R580_9NEOP|nr:hypothetical protein B7P43_G02294 [Cryptotermes secundus]